MYDEFYVFQDPFLINSILFLSEKNTVEVVQILRERRVPYEDIVTNYHLNHRRKNRNEYLHPHQNRLALSLICLRRTKKKRNRKKVI